MASLIKKSGCDIRYIQYKVNGRWKRVSTKTDKKKIAQEVLKRYKIEKPVKCCVSPPGNDSPHTHPAIPGGLHSRRARVRFTGCGYLLLS